MSLIIDLKAREVLDSRGNPTVEVEIFTELASARAIVPSGASTGTHEACELRDGDARYSGKGVRKAVKNVTSELLELVRGHDVRDQAALDEILIKGDGTENKSRFGANAILGISLAAAHVAAKEQNIMLWEHLNPKAKLMPVPMMNLINGGAHADGGVDFQEFMVMPIGAASFREALRMGAEIFHALKKLLKQDGHATTVGDEGGFAPMFKTNEQPLEYLVKAIESAAYRPGKDVAIALDPATSELYRDGMYHFDRSGGSAKTSEQMIELWESWISAYPIVSIEDALAEEDWAAWTALQSKIAGKCQLVGDDLLVTNTKFLQRGIREKTCSSILVKLNQIGTLTEAVNAIEMAKKASWTAVVSHRSGETEDTTIADFAVGMETGQIKTGSLCRGERIAKYNQLLRIEEALGDSAVFRNPFI